MNTCAVYGCDQWVKARHLCRRHYWSWMGGTFHDEADASAGRLERSDSSSAPVVCVCEQPQPDAVGMCVRCGRLIVTFAHANRDIYRERYPVAWQRAEELGFGNG